MTQAHSDRVDLTGRVLMNKLRVVRLLGEGGMGAVYEVEHLITKHRRALKIMHPRLAANAETIARFIREAGVAGTLRTPYVVETFDAGQLDDGSPYVLMELLEGRPLAALLESHDPIAVGRLVGLICQVLEGLAVAHRAGIVHRDIKPENVFVGVDERGLERVRILDFGISKFTQGQPDYQGTLTAEGAMMGTPYYMSPEQAIGAKDLDERSDLYSVGVMLYEGLARRRPYEGQTLAALVLKIHHGDHVRLHDAAPQLSRGLADIVERSLAVDPKRRFASAEELLAALVPFSESQYVTALQTIRNAAPQFAVTLDAPVAASRLPAVSTQAGTLPGGALPTTSRLPWAIGATVLALGAGLAVWVAVSGAGTTTGAGAGPSAPPVAVTPPPTSPAPMPSGALPPTELPGTETATGTAAETEAGTATETETETETEAEVETETGARRPVAGSSGAARRPRPEEPASAPVEPSMPPAPADGTMASAPPTMEGTMAGSETRFGIDRDVFE